MKKVQFKSSYSQYFFLAPQLGILLIFLYWPIIQTFKDAFTISGFGFGGTYIGKIPFLRIDYIWHDKNLQSLNFKTHKSEFSDHRAISTEILIH